MSTFKKTKKSIHIRHTSIKFPAYRSNGLLDPEIEVRSSDGQMENIYTEIKARVAAAELRDEIERIKEIGVK